MERNVGDTDSLVRVLLGAILGTVSLAILGNAIALPVVLSPLLGGLSLVLLITGATNTCGVYDALGIDTREST